MNNIIFKVCKNYLLIDKLSKNIKEDLNNTNVIDTKNVYFSEEYINHNFELVSSFLNLIIIKNNLNKVVINNFDIAITSLNLINNLPNITILEIFEEKVINYSIFLKLLDNEYLKELFIYDIPSYLLERLDLNKELTIHIKSEILFISNFMMINELHTYSDIFYKKNIIINKFDDNDSNDFNSFLNINKYLKTIEFKYFDISLFNMIISSLIKLHKENIKIIFNEESLNIKEVFNYVSAFKKKNLKKLEDNEITFKINYGEDFKKNNFFKELNFNFVKISLTVTTIIVGLMLGLNIYNNYKDEKNYTDIENDIKKIFSDINGENDNPNIQIINPDEEDISKIKETTTTIYDIKYEKVFEKLLKINDDTVGWLNINNTRIDYPVTQKNDNDYYLKHDYYKNSNRHGWIFLDYRNSIDSLSDNSIIYGHNLSNQKMFGTLRYVLNKSWYTKSSNQIISFNTTKENLKWQIFSIYKTPVTSDYLIANFSNANDKMQFFNMIKSRSIYDFNVELNENDKILTLSTCTNGHNHRLVVHAKLIKEA